MKAKELQHSKTQSISSSNVQIPVNPKTNIYVAKSVRISLINWSNVILIYLPYFHYTLVFLCIALLYSKFWNTPITLEGVSSIFSDLLGNVMDLGWVAIFMSLLLLFSWYSRKSTSVYLLDFACFQPPSSWKASHEEIVELLRRQKTFTPESLEFMQRILRNSGTGQSTAWPPGIMRCLKDIDFTADRSVEAAREEAKKVTFDCVSAVLESTKISPQSIDMLVINCSLFSPTPSLCALVANRFQLRSDVKSYNLSGMGCSAGIISIDLVKQLLQSNPNSTALVVSTENLTQNLYYGNKRSMLIQNTLFRVGGSAIILSNKWQDGFRAKYKLLHTIRYQNSSDEGIQCVYEQEDSDLNHGVKLSKEIVTVAGKALQANLTLLGPLILPLREQTKVLLSIALRQFLNGIHHHSKLRGYTFIEKYLPHVKYYVPDFKRAVDHFCIHAGGRAVIDGIQKNLFLSNEHVEPSRETLKHYGNTSSSSIWYELKFIEDNAKARRGHRILQVAFGSGFKCNSAVWLRL